jgi:hypothetical protein
MTLSRRVRAAALMAALAVGAAGCGQTGAGGGLLASRGGRYCMQAGALGAAGGAAAGALAGRAVAGQHNNTGAMLAGALIGAIASAAASCSYGVWVAGKREAYDNEQAMLDGELENSRQTNQSLAELNGRLEGNLAEREAELDALRRTASRSRRQAASQERLAAQLQQGHEGAKQQLAAAEGELQRHRQALADLRSQPQQVDPNQLDAYRQQVAELEGAVRELEDLTQQYANASGAVAQL